MWADEDDADHYKWCMTTSYFIGIKPLLRGFTNIAVLLGTQSLLRRWLSVAFVSSTYFICFRVIYTITAKLMAVFTIYFGNISFTKHSNYTSTAHANRQQIHGNTTITPSYARPIVKHVICFAHVTPFTRVSPPPLTLIVIIILVCFNAGT